MLIILLGILLGVLILCFFGDGRFASGVIIIAFFAGVFVPITGYEETVVEERELIPLTEDTGKQYYIVKVSDNTYSYKVNEKYENSKEEYENIVMIAGEEVELIEKKDCKKPVIKEYITKPKRNFITFALFGDNQEYVIYVPEGSVIE